MQPLIAGILDVMPDGKGHVTEIARHEIEVPRLSRCGEHAPAGLSLSGPCG